MFKLNWDATGEKIWETGLDRGVLYPMDTTGAYPNGVAWNGLISVSESPSGAEANPFYADNIEYANVRSVEKFGATVEAYTYPDEFAACNGEAELVTGVRIGQQKRQAFGMAYRTKIGNDIEGEDLGYKIHLVYGATAAPSEKNRQTVNESPELMTMSWELSTTPVIVPGFKPTAHLEIDSRTVSAKKLAAFEEILYGTKGTEGTGGTTAKEARLPLPSEVATLLAEEAAG